MAVGLALVLLATLAGCGGRNTLAGPSPAATVNGAEISRSEVDAVSEARIISAARDRPSASNRTTVSSCPGSIPRSRKCLMWTANSPSARMNAGTWPLLNSAGRWSPIADQLSSMAVPTALRRMRAARSSRRRWP